MKSQRKIRLVHFQTPFKKFLALLSEIFAIENKSPYKCNAKYN